MNFASEIREKYAGKVLFFSHSEKRLMELYVHEIRVLVLITVISKNNETAETD